MDLQKTVAANDTLEHVLLRIPPEKITLRLESVNFALSHWFRRRRQRLFVTAHNLAKLIIASLPAHDITDQIFIKAIFISWKFIRLMLLSVLLPILAHESIKELMLLGHLYLSFIGIDPFGGVYEVRLNNELLCTRKMTVPFIVLSGGHIVASQK